MQFPAFHLKDATSFLNMATKLQRPPRSRISVVQYVATRSVTATKTETQYDQW